MRPEDLWRFLTGYLRLRISGPGVERFVNLTAARGHRLWRTFRGRRALEANVSLSSFRHLRSIARRTGCRVQIIKKKGLPFLFGQARRRPLLVAGACLSLVALYFLSSTVWVVRVDGAENLDPDLIREVAGSLGLERGVLKMTLDPGEIERGMLLAVHGLSWVAVEFHGAVAVIKVVERDPLSMPDFPEPPADLVAARDGLITKLIVLAGEAVVAEGDTVRVGDTLIIGRQPAGAPPPPGLGVDEPTPAPLEPVVAKGIVEARVWYQAYAEVRLHTLSHEPSGEEWLRVSIRLGGFTIPVWGWWSRPHGLYERHSRTWTPPWWTAGSSPVEAAVVKYVGMSDVRQDYTPEEAERIGREAALGLLGEKFPEGVTPISFDFEVVTKNGILIGVLATAETVEDIGTIRQRQ